MRFSEVILTAMALFSLPQLNAQEADLDQELTEQVNKITEQSLVDIDTKETIDIGLDSAQRKLGRGLLHVLLSSEFVIYSKTLNYHWNVVGDRFGELHAFFQRLYEDQFKAIDLLAERIRAIGWQVNATLAAYQRNSKIADEAAKNLSADQMLKNLLNDYQESIKYYRSAITALEKADDSGTSNFLAELLVQHEKSAWMIRAYITKN